MPGAPQLHTYITKQSDQRRDASDTPTAAPERAKADGDVHASNTPHSLTETLTQSLTHTARPPAADRAGS